MKFSRTEKPKGQPAADPRKKMLQYELLMARLVLDPIKELVCGFRVFLPAPQTIWNSQITPRSKYSKNPYPSSFLIFSGLSIPEKNYGLKNTF